jgi:hypothetical protein
MELSDAYASLRRKCFDCYYPYLSKNCGYIHIQAIEQEIRAQIVKIVIYQELP